MPNKRARKEATLGDTRMILTRVWTLTGLAALVLVACADDTPEAVVQTAPESQIVAPAPAPVLVETNAFDPTRIVPIALLAPLETGNEISESRAQSLVHAAQLALEELGVTRVDLRLYATAEDPLRAAEAAEQALVEGARMIIGPLFSASVEAVTPLTQAAQVPVLSLSNNTDVVREGIWIMGPTFQDRARRLMSHAAEQQFERVGLIYSRDVEGQTGRAAIRAAAVREGVPVVMEASYERSREGIPEAAETFVTTMVSAEVDALVMTDRDSGLIYAASFLPFYGLDTSEVQMICLQPLDGEIYAPERALQRAWFADASQANLADFAARYEMRFGMPPNPLAPLAYDAVVAAVTLLKDAHQTGDTTPFGLEDITRGAGYQGALGHFRILEGGDTARALSVNQVRRNGPREIAAERLLAPRSIAVRPVPEPAS